MICHIYNNYNILKMREYLFLHARYRLFVAELFRNLDIADGILPEHCHRQKL